MEPVHDEMGLLLVEQFREQLNNLSAAVQLLTPVVRETGGEQYDPYLSIVNQSLYRMLRMLGNLEYLQIPENEMIFQPKILDLAGLCRELTAQAAPLTAQAGVELSYQEELGCLLGMGDERLLRRMLLGLMANAVRAAGQGGKIGLRLTERDGKAMFVVWDTGQGMLFPSEMLEGSLHRPDGLGLGLRVARRIVGLHGGSLVFEQREERGGRAVVSIPLRNEEGGGILKSPNVGRDFCGGFSDVLVELAGVLPYTAFGPADLE